MGPPGMTCSSRNTITLMSHSSGTACSRRLAMYNPIPDHSVAGHDPRLPQPPVLCVPSEAIPDVRHPPLEPVPIGMDGGPIVQVNVGSILHDLVHGSAIGLLPGV